MKKALRNIAIIAHVDHGKTTLVDKLLQQSLSLDPRRPVQERVMDSNDLERERGITILAKNTAIEWQDYRINIVDTPGHADFGGEVERVLSMVDSVLLLVDAVDGPMPQTRFVTQKAFSHGLKPIVVINKVDRPGAQPEMVINKMFDLFAQLGASDDQLDFTVVYASALHGYAGLALDGLATDMTPLLETIVRQVPPPKVEEHGGLQMQISALDYSSYVGVIGIARIARGEARPGQAVVVVDTKGQTRTGKIAQILGYFGLERRPLETAGAGDIVAVSGLGELRISDTICDPNQVEALSPLRVDEPTVSMVFRVNDSPMSGREGKWVTSRQLRERLARELVHNVALKVEDTPQADAFYVSGRGELHLAILIENMRREGYELSVSKPKVILKEQNGVTYEPYELVVVDVPEEYQGTVMEHLGERRATLLDMTLDGQGRSRLEYRVPARGLIGFHTEFMSMTAGSGLLHHVFDAYDVAKPGAIGRRQQGVLIANAPGKATGYALFNLQTRGRLLIDPQVEVYEGMIVGIHSRDNDLVVNVTREKQLTNIRASGTDENIVLTPPIRFSLEQALEFIEEDELVEVTPKSIRIRKRHLTENDRKRHKSSDHS